MTAITPHVLLIIPLLLAAAAPRGPDVEQDAVQAGREALRNNGTVPWYDPRDDRVGRFDVITSEDDKRRHSDWTATQSPKQRSNWSIGTWFGSVLRAVAWVLLTVLAIGLVWSLVRAAMWAESSLGGQGSARIENVVVGADRMEDLPIPLAEDETDILATARSFFEAGDLGKAIVYVFAYQLVELDKHSLIRLSRGKTNRQYLSELSVVPRLAELVRRTMLAFEDVFFGHHELSRQRFQACWDGLDDFRLQLEQRRS